MCHHITPQAGENGAKTAGKGEKTKGGKGKGKGWNRPDRQGHGGTHSRTEEKEKLKLCRVGSELLLSPLMCPFVTGGGFLFTGITGSCNPLGRHTGALFSRQIFLC